VCLNLWVGNDFIVYVYIWIDMYVRFFIPLACEADSRFIYGLHCCCCSSLDLRTGRGDFAEIWDMGDFDQEKFIGNFKHF
jgi:hypothetical protein